MKNILIIIVLITLSFAGRSQSTICPALQAFTGEWRYISGQDEIRVYLRAGDYTILEGSGTTIAKLWGWHEYKRAGTVVESNYANRFMTLPTNSGNAVANSYSISLQMPQCAPAGNKLIGNIDDISQCNEMKMVTIIFNTAQNQLIWEQRHSQGFGFGTNCKGMTLPRTFVLTKQ